MILCLHSTLICVVLLSIHVVINNGFNQIGINSDVVLCVWILEYTVERVGVSRHKQIMTLQLTTERAHAHLYKYRHTQTQTQTHTHTNT